MNSPSKLGTPAGFLAVFCWSIAAPVLYLIGDINPFLYLVCLHGGSFILFCCYWCVRRENPFPKLKQIPVWFYLCAIVGVAVHSLMWILALQNAPPLEATLIIYTWPLLIVIFTAIALQQKLYWFHYLACALGFFGIIALMLGKGLSLGEISFGKGHLYALFASLSWSIYAAIAAKFKEYSVYCISVVYITSAIVNFIIWYGISGAPLASQLSVVLSFMVSITSVTGFVCWDFGMRNGNTKLIGVASFMIPVLATLYLVIVGAGVYTSHFLVALGLVMSGIFLVKYGPKVFLKRKI